MVSTSRSAQPRGSVGAREDAALVLGDALPGRLQPPLDLGVQRPAGAAHGEDRRALGQLVLDDDDGQVVLPATSRAVTMLASVSSRDGRLDGQDAVEVLLLDVDDDEGSARRGHEISQGLAKRSTSTLSRRRCASVSGTEDHYR